MQFVLGLLVGLIVSYFARRAKLEKYNQTRIELYYQRRAASYNLTDQWVGFGNYRPRILLRQRLLDNVGLKPGDRVLDLACGAGGNFPYIMERIGETGELVGVDYSEAMLKEAQKLIDERGWKNVYLVQNDAATLKMGETYDAVVCAFGMVVIPNYQDALQRAFDHVRPGGVLGIADLCESQRWYMLPINALMDIMDATIITDTTRRPWEIMQPWVEDYRREELLLGYMYVATGRKPK